MASSPSLLLDDVAARDRDQVRRFRKALGKRRPRLIESALKWALFASPVDAEVDLAILSFSSASPLSGRSRIRLRVPPEPSSG
jgi:hypothetical protein